MFFFLSITDMARQSTYKLQPQNLVWLDFFLMARMHTLSVQNFSK